MNKSLILLICLTSCLLVANADNDDDFECSEAGKFRDNTDSSCKSYHVCTAGYNGQWIQYSSSCPDGKIFDGNTGHCSATATCRKYQEDSSSSSDSSSSDSDGFECKKAGVHDDLSDPTCTQYFDCKQTHKGYYAVRYSCSKPSRFDPKIGQCSKHYICPRRFQCKKVGRYANENDVYSKKYFLCSKKKNGEFVQTSYTCPLNSRFNSEYDMCVENTSSEEDYYHDHTLPIENWNHLDSFVCQARGYSDQKNDQTCRIYYFCDVAADGKLYKSILVCPSGYGWCDETNLCTPNYQCRKN